MINFQDLRQTKEYCDFLQTQGWQIESIDSVSAFIKKLPFLPISVIKIQRTTKIPPVPLINQIAKKHHALFVKLEPFLKDCLCTKTVFAKSGFKPDSWPLLPPKTLWIDLSKDEEELLKAMEQKTRYSLKKAKSSGLKIKIISGDKLENQLLKDFYQLFKISRKAKNLWLPSFKEIKNLFKCFGKNSFLLLCLKEKILAGIILLFSKNMAFYYHAASTEKGNQLSAPTFLVWEAIKLAKRKGKKIFDFEGIYDPRFKVTKPWQGFTHFKKGFGGEEKSFESYIKYYFPF